MTILTEKAMLVRCEIRGRAFAKTKKDKALSKEVADRHGADPEKAAHYRKILIDPAYTSPIDKIGNAAYLAHIKQTLPWDDEGWRILPATNYFDYMAEQRGFREKYRRAVELFESQYDEAIHEALNRPGNLVTRSDFPDADKLFVQHPISGEYLKFGIGNADRGIEVQPIPDNADFRVDLNAIETAKLKSQVESRMQSVLTAAVGDLWSRLKARVEVLHNRLEAYSEADRKVMKSAWIDNLADIVALIPKLNLTGDANLTRICQEVEVRLIRWNTEQLKSSPVTLTFVRDQAADILRQMASYTGDMDLGDDETMDEAA